MIFEIQAPDGKVFEVEGDRMPTENELNDIFSSMASSEISTPPAQPEVEITKIKASDMIGEKGFNNKPFDKLNNYLNKLSEVKVNEDNDFSVAEAWKNLKSNIFRFEVSKSSQKLEGALVLEETVQEAVDVSKQYAEATKQAVVEADISQIGTGIKEVSKAVGRATVDFAVAGLGNIISMVGDLMYNDTDINSLSKLDAYKVKTGNMTATTYKKIGKYLQDFAEMGVKSEWLKEDPEIFSGSFVDNPSLTRLLSFGASSVPSLVTAGGLTKMGVPFKISGGILAGLESSDVYGEAREAGEGKAKALGLFALSSAGTAYLETKGLENLFDNKMKTLAGKTFSSILSEGFTEYGQTIYQNAVKKYGYDETQELFEGAFEALIGGAIGGGGAQVVNSTFDAFSKKADKYGVTQEEKEQIYNAVSSEMNDKSEKIDALFQSNYEKSFATIDEYIANNKEDAFVKQAMEKKQQLDSIYNDYYSNLVQIMPEEQAKSNAALVRNSAFFFSEAFGMSPSEYVEKMGVKIQKGTVKGLGDGSLEQAMYRSPLKTFDEFYDDVFNEPTKKARYYRQKSPNGVDYDILSDTVRHDKNKHALSKEEWQEVNANIDNVESSVLSARKGFYGIPVLIKLDVNGKKYGLTIEHNPTNGRNFVTTAFTDSEKAIDKWISDEVKKKERQEMSNDPTSSMDKIQSVAHLGNSLPDIISNLDNNVNSSLKQQTLLQESLDIANQNAESDANNPAYEGETININGVERTVYNSNGDRIAMSEPALRNFYKWFGDSKVVDEQGRPLVVYHGTNAEFDTFENQKVGDYGKGFYFVDSKLKANEYAIKRGGNITIPVYLSIKNPFIARSSSESQLRSDIGERFTNKGLPIKKEKIQEILSKNGYDGVVIPIGEKPFGFDYYLSFASNQIKSTSNRGAFNPEDDRIYYQNNTNAPRGAYRNSIIYLFENANESTLPHELAHYWKDMLRKASSVTPKAVKMLNDVDKWTNEEFERKYIVQNKGDRFVVANKQGFIVYDHNFTTEQEAKDYGLEELFAQGFEQYIKEGKAPNKSLKQAFRNFIMWLKRLYRDALDLNIRLSPDIKNVYADILGGTDIDFFLDTEPDTFIENRVYLGNEQEKDLEEQIAEAQKSGIKLSDPSGKRFVHAWETAMIPLSTRLARINPKLRNRIRRYEFEITNDLNKYYAELRPFLNKWKIFNPSDEIAFDLALKNDYVKKQLSIVDKYGAREEWEKVRKVLLDIFDRSVSAGLDVNYRPDYFPRNVKDLEGFMAYLKGGPEWAKFEQALNNVDPNHDFTLEEQVNFINKYMRGIIKVDLMPYKYGSEKERKIGRVTNEMNQFYMPSMEALLNYVEGMNSRIKAAEFLGKDAEKIEQSIGGYLTYLLNNNMIKATQVDEVREILLSRFNQKGVSNKWLSGARDLSYIHTMGGINSAIAQIEDLSVSIYKAGFWNTLTTTFEDKKIKRKDLGLEKISEEFVNTQSKSSKAVNWVFRITGLDKIDSFGKETLVNAMVKKFSKMDDETLREYIEPIMEEETKQTIQDIKNEKLTDNVLYLVFSELSDVQPTSLSELPAFYNTGGNLRVLYMLKSFMVKRIDIFRNQCFDKIRSKDRSQRIEGVQNLFRLALLMITCGVSKDWLINMLYNRKIDLPEMVINNMLGLVGFGKFHIYQARDKGAGEVIKDFMMPPLFAFWDELLGDAWRISSGKRKLREAETLKAIPLIGRFYYWWVGGGRTKEKKRRKRKD